MNFNSNLWDETEAKEFGEFENLELGGHELIIVSAEEYRSETTGNLSLKVCVDIAGNDKQKGFFKKQFDNNTNNPKKWPTGATRYLSLKDENIAYLKGFITTLEKSNVNFKFNKNGEWSQIVNLKSAGQFGLEEYQKDDGTISVRTRLNQFRSLDKLAEITIPPVRLLNGSTINYSEYEEYKKSKNNNPFSQNNNDDVIEISDDFLD